MIEFPLQETELSDAGRRSPSLARRAGVKTPDLPYDQRTRTRRAGEDVTTHSLAGAAG
jgi:hypothetical protein